MRTYRVSANVADLGRGAGVQGRVTRFAGTQAEARAEVKAIVAEHGVKRDAVRVAEIDVPTGKEGLLAFLNELVKS